MQHIDAPPNTELCAFFHSLVSSCPSERPLILPLPSLAAPQNSQKTGQRRAWDTEKKKQHNSVCYIDFCHPHPKFICITYLYFHHFAFGLRMHGQMTYKFVMFECEYDEFVWPTPLSFFNWRRRLGKHEHYLATCCASS